MHRSANISDLYQTLRASFRCQHVLLTFSLHMPLSISMSPPWLFSMCRSTANRKHQWGGTASLQCPLRTRWNGRGSSASETHPALLFLCRWAPQTSLRHRRMMSNKLELLLFIPTFRLNIQESGDAFQLTTVAQSGYLSYRSLPVSSNESNQSAKTRAFYL